MAHNINGEAVANRINSARKQNGQSVRKLAEESGVAAKTLSRKLDHTPDLLNLSELMRISAALGISLEELIRSNDESADSKDAA